MRKSFPIRACNFCHWYSRNKGPGMHEIKLVKELVEKALNIAREKQAKKVKKIFVEIGANSYLTPESFSHLFREFSKATILASAEIVVSSTQEEGLVLESLELEI